MLGRDPGTGGAFHLLHTSQGESQDGQPLTVAPQDPWTGIQTLRIVSDANPSWVAWRELIVLAP